MSQTRTSASDRDLRHAAVRYTGYPLLALTSIIAVLVIGLAYAGRLATFNATPAINLNAVSNASELQPLFERSAAQKVVNFIESTREAGRALPNVGALRPLLTATELATLKPSLAVRTAQDFKRQTVFWGALYFISFWAVALLWRLRGVRGDCLLLAAAHLLTAIGFAALLSRPDPLRDTLLFVRYAQAIVGGLGLFGLLSLLDFRKAAFLTLSYVPLLGAFLLSVILILFGDGPGDSNVKVNLGPVQPVEAIRLLLALFLAGYFARRWELLRQAPRLDYVVPVLAGVAASLLFFFLQRDLGPALFVSCVFLAVYAVARNRAGLAIAGLAVLVLGFYLGYTLNVSTTLSGRVQMWMSPWDNAVRGGDQIAQSLWGLSTGGLTGTGLGLGDTRYLPAGHTDLVLPAIGEELGFIGLFLIAVVFAVMAARGFRIAQKAANDYGFFLATTVTLFLIVPVLIMVAGNLGIIPLTGVVTPFLSYGGSAMLMNFAGLGILSAIRVCERTPILPLSEGESRPRRRQGVRPDFQPFLKSIRYLQTGLACATLALIALLLNVQFFSADNFVVKPHLSLQADGGRRYQYNQRILDVARMIPRGTIYDHAGLPLATGSAAVATMAREAYGKVGIRIDSSCTEPFERCYPLGGAAFHLLGDERTRTNWSATNTSYVERDQESKLRGFDDHATVVGDTNKTIRRDYRELVPLLRHRHQPQHSTWRQFLSEPRDITMSIDARLQFRLATILSRHAAKSAKGRAAAVVVNPDTGDLLASASYPFPTLDGKNQTDALLDRARYGLYPPGSTFKLVTAAAALERDINLSQSTFMCASLANGRVGARIPGWGRVRDDVLDTHAHGSISMHDGIVRSCNAYFGQLAVRIGPQALMETAGRFGISTAPSNSVERLRETLPHAGYGQGFVVTSPLRMARVAAAVASADAESSIPREAAALLGQYMRDAVVHGTGRRSLGSHPWKIAGKTGTAEVRGAPSHAWFVGFAPYGEDRKKIAVAVIIENAGYGGLAAAPVAGEIVSAAAELGLIQ